VSDVELVVVPFEGVTVTFVPARACCRAASAAACASTGVGDGEADGGLSIPE